MPLVVPISACVVPRLTGPGLPSEDPQGTAVRSDRQTRMEEEAHRTGLETANPFPVTVELQRRRVVKDKHLSGFSTPLGGPQCVNAMDSGKVNSVIIEESVQSLELPLRGHCFGKAHTRLSCERQADAFEPGSSSPIAENRAAKLLFDANCPHTSSRSPSGRCGKEMCGIVSHSRPVTPGRHRRDGLPPRPARRGPPPAADRVVRQVLQRGQHEHRGRQGLSVRAERPTSSASPAQRRYDHPTVSDVM